MGGNKHYFDKLFRCRELISLTGSIQHIQKNISLENVWNTVPRIHDCALYSFFNCHMFTAFTPWIDFIFAAEQVQAQRCYTLIFNTGHGFDSM